MRILLVEDSQTLRRIQRSLLADLGHTLVDEAADGAEALELAARCAPDLILVDSAMAGMDGMAFVRAFRRSNKTTPIIEMTTDLDRTRCVGAIRAGVNGTILKPFTADMLGQRIEQVMAGRARAAA